MKAKKMQKKGVQKGRPNLQKPRKKTKRKERRKILYPRKKGRLTKAEAKRRVKKLKGVKLVELNLKRIKPIKPKVKPKVKPAAKINRNIVARLIRESAIVKTEYLRNEKTCFRETKLKVTPAFIDEYIDRVIIGIEANIPVICEQVLAKGRKTLMVKEGNGINDVVNFFDMKKNTIADLPSNLPKPLIEQPGFKKLYEEETHEHEPKQRRKTGTR